MDPRFMTGMVEKKIKKSELFYESTTLLWVILVLGLELKLYLNLFLVLVLVLVLWEKR